MSKHSEKKRGLILGGTCELALCLGRLLIDQGFFPVLTWRSEEGHRQIDLALTSHRGFYETARLDLGDPESITALLTKESAFDFLVDFAQGDYETLIAGADEERIYSFFTAYVAARAVLLKNICRGMLRKKQGRLVYISSSAAERPAPGQGFYGAVKLASEALYRNCGLELAGKGITSVILRVGYIDAGRGREFLQTRPEAVRQVPLCRALKAEEVAETILFLLSPAAAGINATTLTMDGGLSAGKMGITSH
jgi:3-oxoacyl-[acyl-carrier protein] reductase